jgi:hypothetical protein
MNLLSWDVFPRNWKVVPKTTLQQSRFTKKL